MEIFFEPLSSLALIGIGVILIGLEAIMMSFFIFWFGVGFLIVGIWHYLYPFHEGAYQLASVAMVSMILLFSLKNKFKKLCLNINKSVRNDFLNTQGEGIILSGMVSYKGTLWKYEPNIKLEEGTIVKIIEAKNNRVKIEVKDKENNKIDD